MTANRPLVTAGELITLPTRDFERANDFYGDVLRLPCSTRWGDTPARDRHPVT